MDTLRQFMLRFPGAASQLQSAHISLVDCYDWEDQGLPPLAPVFGGPAFRSLRANARLDLTDLTSFQALHTLDLGFGRNYRPDALRGLFGPSSPLRTLIIRDLAPAAHFVGMPVAEASTISSLAVSFSLPFHSRDCYGILGGFEDFANTFAFPNLGYLEIIGGFTSAVAEPRIFPVKLDAPFFPRLRTLRLENIEFSSEGIALMQSFSPEIISLELIYTTGNHHLLDKSGGDATWPALRSLTVETSDKVISPKWLSSFLTMRTASLGAGRRILNLTLPLWMAGIALPIELRPEIRWLRNGPSPALADGLPGHGFYLDGCNMRARDFEYVQVPESRCCLGYLEWNREQKELEIDDDLRRADEMIAETFKLAGEFTKAKGMRRELKRETRRDLKAERRLMGRRKRQRCDITPDFSC
ncbi:hypothetical protein B0H14DRAFT_3439828 [Mycena olivaceomarginata]|nr:hypothetical protein B0H14DRAFT_3439828 [Mycena olivaceomarginata]